MRQRVTRVAGHGAPAQRALNSTTPPVRRLGPPAPRPLAVAAQSSRIDALITHLERHACKLCVRSSSSPSPLPRTPRSRRTRLSCLSSCLLVYGAKARQHTGPRGFGESSCGGQFSRARLGSISSKIQTRPPAAHTRRPGRVRGTRPACAAPCDRRPTWRPQPPCSTLHEPPIGTQAHRTQRSAGGGCDPTGVQDDLGGWTWWAGGPAQVLGQGLAVDGCRDTRTKAGVYVQGVHECCSTALGSLPGWDPVCPHCSVRYLPVT
jgi:hypothetical protein